MSLKIDYNVELIPTKATIIMNFKLKAHGFHIQVQVGPLQIRVHKLEN